MGKIIMQFPGFPPIKVDGPAINGIDAKDSDRTQADDRIYYGVEFRSVTTWEGDYGTTRNYENGVLVESTSSHSPADHRDERAKFMAYARSLTEEECAWIERGIDTDTLYDEND